MKIGDIVTRTDLVDGERYVVIDKAGRKAPPETWARPAHARMSGLGDWIVPAGWHVQSLATGRLATYPEAALNRVGNLIAETAGLLPRPRVRIGS